jgi:hypothetical protein
MVTGNRGRLECQRHGFDVLVHGSAGRNATVETTFNIDQQIGPHSDVFAEYIGDFRTHGMPSETFNFGGSFRITKAQQIDFRAGFGLTMNSPIYFVGIGYSIRFDGLW